MRACLCTLKVKRLELLTPNVEHICLQFFDVIGWMAEGHPAYKNWMVRYWHGYLSGARCKWFACCPADATVTQSSLASSSSRMVYLSAASLLRLSCNKRLLNGCSSSSSWYTYTPRQSLNMHWPGCQKIKGHGYTVTKTVTFARMLVAAVAIVLLLPARNCMIYCLAFF